MQSNSLFHCNGRRHPCKISLFISLLFAIILLWFELQDSRVHCVASLHRLQSRIDKLEIRLSRTNENLEKSSKRNKKVQQQLVNKLKTLKNRCQLLEAEKEHLEIEMKAGKHGIPREEYNRMR